MKRNQRKKEKDLAGIGEVVASAGLALAASATAALPDLGSVVVVEVPDLAAIAADKNQLREWLVGGNGGTSALDVVRRLGEAIAPALGLDRDGYDAVAERVAKNITTAWNIIFSKSEKMTAGVKDQLRSAFIQAVLAKMARTHQALVRFADIAVRNFVVLVPAPAGVNTVTLPLTPEGGGRWQWTSLSVAPGHRDAHRILLILRSIEREAQHEKREVRHEKLSDLRKETTGSLLDVLEKGGVAAFRSPDRPIIRDGKQVIGDGSRPLVRFGGDVKVRVAGGRIFPLEAVGGCSRKVREMADLVVSIPVSVVKEERIQLDRRILGEDKFYLTLELHGLCRAGYLQELERQPGRDELAAIKAAQNVPPADFLLASAVGTAVFFFRSNRGPKGGDKPAWFDPVTKRAYNRVTFAVQRREDGAIALSACLKETDELFAGCREFTQPGEKFSGLPSPLKEILRKLYAIFLAQRLKPQQTAGGAADSAAGTPSVEEQFLEAAGEAKPGADESVIVSV